MYYFWCKAALQHQTAYISFWFDRSLGAYSKLYFNINSTFFAANLAVVLHYAGFVFLSRDLWIMNMCFAKAIIACKTMRNDLFTFLDEVFELYQEMLSMYLHILHVSFLGFWLWRWRWFSQWFTPIAMTCRFSISAGSRLI